MNKKDYYEKLKEVISSRECCLNFLEDWYKSQKNILSELAKQNAEISHPRHKGDLREADFKSILKVIIPESFKISKGFAINHFGAMSRELDCLIYSKDKTFTLIKKDDLEYIPFTSVLSAIEIKSNYTLDEIRKSIINCLSLKAFVPPEKYKYFYSIFAYNSKYDLKKLCTILNKFSKEIEELLIKNDNSTIRTLPIDMIYILGKGLIYRTRTKSIKSHATNLEDILNSSGNFACIEDSDNINFTFLFYIGTIIDFVINENLKRKPSQFLAHVMAPEILKQKLKNKGFQGEKLFAFKPYNNS